MELILREIFSQPLPGETAQNRMSASSRFTGDQMPDPSTARNSSVLILLYQQLGDWYFPLIKRPTYDGAHSGQISLPGGKWESGDNNAWEAGLRETNEEIGVSEGIQFIGTLTPLYIPNSNFMVYPQVGYISTQPVFKPDFYEVEELVVAPVKDFFNLENRKTFTREIRNYMVTAPFFEIKGHCVWGATAMILSEFFELAGPSLVKS
jgi:8-oxo-dGTP pyrophosphatase MutT (NUDIX family)